MPEGHTIHRLARWQHFVLAGRRVSSSSPQGRFLEGAEAIDGRTLRRVEPLGKHLLYHFSVGAVHAHLGLYGGFKKLRADAGGAWLEPTPNVRWRAVSTAAGVGFDLSGPTACEVLGAGAVRSLRDRLGPDLLAPDAAERRDAVRDRVLSRPTPIGVQLMDQSVVAGLGNIYRAELLYRARIDPRTPGREVPAEAFEGIYDDAVRLIRVGVRHQKILTVEPAALGKERWRQLGPGERFWVYKRETCRGCGGPVEEIQQAGRKVYLCPAEQA